MSKPWRQIEQEANAQKKAALLAALKRNDWGLSATARELEIGYSSLQSLIKKHGIERAYKKHAWPAHRPPEET